MKLEAARFVVSVLVLLIPGSLSAQTATATISGTVTNPFGARVLGAKISVKNVADGQVLETQTDSNGTYSVNNLVPGDYLVSASAEGLALMITVTLAAGANRTVDLALSPNSVGPADTGSADQQTLPNAPSSSKTEPSLSDLGFPKEQTTANPKEQALLDKRTHMLKIHQKMGLITTIPLITTLALSVNAGGKSKDNADRTAHLVMGAITGDLYGITAYYAIRAPRIKGTQTKGPIKFHKVMAWIHGPGMILTPILGALAYDQKSNGEKVHGIASAHGPVAIVTAGAFGAALLSVSLKF